MRPFITAVSCTDTSAWHKRSICSHVAATAAGGKRKIPTVLGRAHQHHIQLPQTSWAPPHLALPMALTSHPRVHPQGMLKQFTTSLEEQQLPQANPCLSTDQWLWRAEPTVCLKTATHPCLATSLLPQPPQPAHGQPARPHRLPCWGGTVPPCACR